MTFSLILAGISVVLFAYWFRYSCVLILRTRTAEDFSQEVCRANSMSFVQVRSAIEAEGAVDLDQAFDALERDFSMISSLIERHGQADENGVEHKLLGVNYRVTKAWFKVSRAVGLKSAKSALREMADTVAFFANSFGQATAAGAA
jgi:hypothetical protein